MTLGMPTREKKTCNKHSHTAFALTDLSGKANGNRVCESIRHKQKLYSALFSKGLTTSMCKCENGTVTVNPPTYGDVELTVGRSLLRVCLHVLLKSQLALHSSLERFIMSHSFSVALTPFPARTQTYRLTDRPTPNLYNL